MDLAEGDTLIVLNKKLFQRELGFPAEFYNRGVPSKLVVKKANIGSSVHLIEQIFDKGVSSSHRYSICTIRSLVESDVLKKEQYNSKFPSQKSNKTTRRIGSTPSKISSEEDER